MIRLELNGASVLYTGREGGVSEGPYAELNLGLYTGDDPEAVSANHELLAAQVGLTRRDFALGHQVHGTEVRALREPPSDEDRAADADGQATRLEGVAPLVLVADCLPVALSTGDGVAMLHAGWRGLAGGVLERGVATLRGLGARGELHAAIGPGAGACCYEAGAEVHAAVGHSAGRNVDLKAAAAERLRDLGASEVQDVGICTICDERYFSHRRSGGVTGRQAGVAWLG
ncbi:MAG TPA: polyphenol oxidase family protein [Solirubrobacteraceae bacterium]|nr:polyphenol oxidase family protein [Solirubrobacteraceae bacterium]